MKTMFRAAGVVQEDMLVKTRCVRHAGSEALTWWLQLSLSRPTTHLHPHPHPRQHWQCANLRHTLGTSENTCQDQSSRSKSTRRSRSLSINQPPLPSSRWRNAQAYTHCSQERMISHRRGVPGTSSASYRKTSIQPGFIPHRHIISYHFCHYFMLSTLSPGLPSQSSD